MVQSLSTEIFMIKFTALLGQLLFHGDLYALTLTAKMFEANFIVWLNKRQTNIMVDICGILVNRVKSLSNSLIPNPVGQNTWSSLVKLSSVLAVQKLSQKPSNFMVKILISC